MKLSNLYKLSSLFMAMMIFVSSLGYSLDIHYCGDEIFDFSFVGDVTSCQGKEKEETNSNQVRFTKKGCCDFDHIKLETSKEFQLSSYDLDQKEVKAITFLYVYSQIIFIDNLKELSLYTIDFPPIICTNKVYKKSESFLI